ncbi:MAG: HIT domain-containing protein [Candidatus Nomurabacteria bacterium]|jgi:histidine triad (HIT) family protein|nr:HIT domain-containing protein [Candidatus Nomurabacteria bacterium]
MKESVFTKIINGEIPAYKVYENDRVLAFLDIHPLTDGHVLLIPKDQIDYLFDLPDEDYEYLWQMAKKIARALKKAMKTLRVGVVVEGFAVPHIHIHLVPINNDQELKHGARRANMSEEEFKEIAKRIKAEIDF